MDADSAGSVGLVSSRVCGSLPVLQALAMGAGVGGAIGHRERDLSRSMGTRRSRSFLDCCPAATTYSLGLLVRLGVGLGNGRHRIWTHPGALGNRFLNGVYIRRHHNYGSAIAA